MKQTGGTQNSPVFRILLHLNSLKSHLCNHLGLTKKMFLKVVRSCYTEAHSLTQVQIHPSNGWYPGTYFPPTSEEKAFTWIFLMVRNPFHHLHCWNGRCFVFSYVTSPPYPLRAHQQNNRLIYLFLINLPPDGNYIQLWGSKRYRGSKLDWVQSMNWNNTQVPGHIAQPAGY